MPEPASPVHLLTIRPRRRRLRSRRRLRRTPASEPPRNRRRSRPGGPSRRRAVGCTSRCPRHGPATHRHRAKTNATMPAPNASPRMPTSSQVRKPTSAARRERAADAAEQAPEDRARHQREDEQERQQREQSGDVLRGSAQFGLRQRLALDHAHDAIDAGVDAAVIIAAPERRHDVLLDDAVGGRVGQRALEAVADLDAHLAIVERDEQQGAVVDALAAELPLLRDPDRVLLDRPRAASSARPARRPGCPWTARTPRSFASSAATWSGVERAGEVGDRRLQRRERARAAARRRGPATHEQRSSGQGGCRPLRAASDARGGRSRGHAATRRAGARLRSTGPARFAVPLPAPAPARACSEIHRRRLGDRGLVLDR